MTRRSAAFWVLLGPPLLLSASGCSGKFSDCNELRACSNAGTAGASGSSGGSAVQSGVDEAGAAGESSAVGGGSAIGAGGSGEDGTAGAGQGGAGDDSAEAGAGSGGNPPPTVVSVTPADNESSVDPNVKPALDFSEALDPSTVTSSSVELLSGTSAIPGVVTFSGTSALISPSSPLDLLGTYTVSASTDLKDPGGAHLLTAFSSSFTVRDGVWSAAKDLGASAISSLKNSVVAVDGAGNALFLWVDPTFHTLFARWYRAGSWGESIPLSDGMFVGRPDVVLNARGDALVVFNDLFTLYTRQYRNGAWDLPSPALDLDCYYPSIGMSPAGVAHVICDGLTALNARHTDTLGNWAANTTALVNGSTFSRVSFAFSSNDDAIVTWTSSDLVGDGFRSNVQSARFASSHWGEATIIPGSQVEPPDDAGAPAIACDPSGNVMVAWVHQTGANTGILSTSQAPTGAWSAPVELATATGMTPFGAPALVSDGNDFILAWNQMSGSQWTAYQARNVAGIWQTAATPPAHRAVVPSGDQMPGLGVDSRGNLLILWVEAGPTAADRYIEASRYVRASSTWSLPTRLNTFANSTTTATLAVSASGRAAVVYANNTTKQLFANIFD